MKLLKDTSEIFLSGSVYVRYLLDKGKVNIPCLAMNKKSRVVYVIVKKYRDKKTCVFVDSKGNSYSAVVAVDKNYDPVKLEKDNKELLALYNSIELI